MAILNHIDYKALICLLLFYHSYSRDYAEGCHSLCRCESAIMTCTCSDGNQHLKLEPSVDGAGDIPPTVYISDCHEVTIDQWDSISIKPLHKMEVTRVGLLHLNEYFIMGSTGIHSIVIRDTAIDNIKELALSDTENLRHLHFINVSIQEIDSRAFHMLKHVGEIRIVDSTVGLIKSHAFEGVRNVGHFHILNSKFGTIDSNALDLQGVGNITINNANIMAWKERAFAPTDVDNIVIRKSHIGELATMAFSAKNVSNFIVTGTRFDNINSQAFANMSGVSSFVFNSNIIHQAHNDSFILDHHSVTNITVENNKFTCYPADICWMVNSHTDLNNIFFATSKCGSPKPQAGKSLASLSSLYDDEDMCSEEGSGLEPTSVTASPQDKITKTKELAVQNETSQTVVAHPETQIETKPTPIIQGAKSPKSNDGTHAESHLYTACALLISLVFRHYNL